MASKVRWGSSTQLVEDMIGALWRVDRHNPGALQQVGGDGSTSHSAASIKGELGELAKTGGIVIS